MESGRKGTTGSRTNPAACTFRGRRHTLVRRQGGRSGDNPRRTVVEGQFRRRPDHRHLPAVKIRSPANWRRVWSRIYGCNTPVVSENLITFRWAPPGSTTSPAAAARVTSAASAPAAPTTSSSPAESSPPPTTPAACTCSYQMQTSLAMVPDDDAEMWTYTGTRPRSNGGPAASASTQRTGDRIDDAGTQWLEYPSVGGKSPVLKINVTGDKLDYYRNHASLVGSKVNWVRASPASRTPATSPSPSPTPAARPRSTASPLLLPAQGHPRIAHERRHPGPNHRGHVRHHRRSRRPRPDHHEGIRRHRGQRDAVDRPRTAAKDGHDDPLRHRDNHPEEIVGASPRSDSLARYAGRAWGEGSVPNGQRREYRPRHFVARYTAPFASPRIRERPMPISVGFRLTGQYPASFATPATTSCTPAPLLRRH